VQEVFLKTERQSKPDSVQLNILPITHNNNTGHSPVCKISSPDWCLGKVWPFAARLSLMCLLLRNYSSCEDILQPYVYAVMSVVPLHIFLCTQKFNSTHSWFNLFKIKFTSLRAGSLVRMFGEKYFGGSAAKQRRKVSMQTGYWFLNYAPFKVSRYCPIGAKQM